MPRQKVAGLDARYPALWGLPRGGVKFNGDLLYQSLRGPVAQLRREFPFDAILVAWAYPDGYAAARLAQDFNCPVVTRLMGSDINDLADPPRAARKDYLGAEAIRASDCGQCGPAAEGSGNGDRARPGTASV
ncbi:MAG: hypothetical protein QM758_24715 [Armatimonas sp.]